MNTSEREETLFAGALARPAAERVAFLDQACGANSALRGRLTTLLAAHDSSDTALQPPAPLSTTPSEEQPGDRLGHYKLLQKIGEGGCGIVYMADQLEPVHRRVALKVIKLGMDTKEVIARFEAERQALALMDHPNIAHVLDAGATSAGRPFFVMELVRGIPLIKFCDEQNASTAQRLELFIEICHAVQHAHQKGIIHRDLKPSNILVSVNDGVAVPKIIDFGIAKATQGKLTDQTVFTAFEQFIGTPAYMSPEQAVMTSLDVDTRSDIYSLGVLLYELLTGRTPFDARDLAHAGIDEIRRRIREVEPPRPSTRLSTMEGDTLILTARRRQTEPPKLINLVRGDLDWIVMRCLEKDRMRRYETASALAADLHRHLRHEPVTARPPSTLYLLQKLFRRHRLGFAATAIIAAVVFIGALVTAHQASRALRAERQQRELLEAAQQAKAKEAAAQIAAVEERERATRQRLVRQHLLPEINNLIEDGDIAAAYAKAAEAEKDLPDDPALTGLWPRISANVTIETTPPGADLYYKDYRKPETEWKHLGKSPVQGVRMAAVFYRWQIRKEGYCLAEKAFGPQSLKFPLDELGSVPPEMVRIPAGEVRVNGIPSAKFGGFLVDRYEVSNRQYQKFVDQGGYLNRKYWQEPFKDQDRVLTWDEALARFRDSTGRPGPATWAHGTYPQGMGDHPVVGVSWYEAAAYAEFAGKRLPSIYHWKRAGEIATFTGTSTSQRRGQYASIVPFSNFGTNGLSRCGSTHGITQHGVYDIAGNAKEWCLNEAAEGKRYILGGGYGESEYMYTFLDALPPFSRTEMNGFRCIKLPTGSLEDEAVDARYLRMERDYAKAQPVDDNEYALIRRQFSYDKRPLEARVEATDDSASQWRRETITVNAAYNNERLTVFVLLPKNVSPPYQCVVFFPGGNARQATSSEGSVSGFVITGRFFVESGRAFVTTVFNGTWGRNRQVTKPPLGPSEDREYHIQLAKDLGRTLDYLETRPDIRSDKLAYFGRSWGAAVGPILTAVEGRFQTSILQVGGFPVEPLFATSWPLPEIDPVNHAPRVKAPTLMLNGRDDFLFPVETSQRPMFRLLGTPPAHKRHMLFETGHGVPFAELTKFSLQWLDKYLGPVK